MARNRLCLSERRQGFLAKKVLYAFSNGELNAAGTIILTDKVTQSSIRVTPSEDVVIPSDNLVYIKEFLIRELKTILDSPMYATLCYKLEIVLSIKPNKPKVVFDLITAQRKN